MHNSYSKSYAASSVSDELPRSVHVSTTFVLVFVFDSTIRGPRACRAAESGQGSPLAILLPVALAFYVLRRRAALQLSRC